MKTPERQSVFLPKCCQMMSIRHAAMSRDAMTSRQSQASVISISTVSAVEGIQLVPSVCVSVCLSVSTLPTEPFELRT